MKRSVEEGITEEHLKVVSRWRGTILQVAIEEMVHMSMAGNLLTAVPIVGWSGLGPDMNMVLYHNSASTNSAVSVAETVNEASFSIRAWSPEDSSVSLTCSFPDLT